MHNIFTQIKKRTTDMIFPPRCPVCDGIVPSMGEHICTECLPKLRLLTPPYCMKCGKKVAEGEALCTDCREKQHYYDRGRALYEYDSVAPSIYRLKYGNRQEYADYFGEQIALYLEDFIRNTGAEAIIPVPIHKKRRIARGYNQAELLADAVGKRLNIPIEKNLCIRVKNTGALKLLSPAQRQNNLKKAFNIAANDVKLKTIVIIDDIYTTGATIDEISKEFKAVGVEKIYFVTLACGMGI